MRAVILAAAAVAVLFVSGCGGRQKYEGPEKNPAQEDRDYSECDWEASKATGNVVKSSDRQDRVLELIDKCMKAKGYNKK